MQMSHAAMAANTGCFVRFGMVAARSFNPRDNVRVTAAAGVLGNFAIPFVDLDVLGKIAGGKAERVPESVHRLGGIFANQIMRGVAIVTGRHAAMTAVDPTVILLLHDVAVDAGLGIIGQIRRALRINESVGPHPEGESDHGTEHKTGFGRTFHCRKLRQPADARKLQNGGMFGPHPAVHQQLLFPGLPGIKMVGDYRPNLASSNKAALSPELRSHGGSTGSLTNL